MKSLLLLLIRSNKKISLKNIQEFHQLIISDSLQQKRIALWNTYWTPEKKQRVFETLANEGKTLKFSANAVDNF
jgi:hypothetical protein